MYIENKRIRAFFMMVIFCLTYTLSVSYSMPLTVQAGVTGTVSGTNVRVRSSTDTSNTGNVIAKLNTGAQVTILDTVKTSDTYAWYHIGFTLNGNYTEGYITSQFVSKNSDYTKDSDFEAYMNSQGFPDSYREGLRQVHAQYPDWVFTADHVSYDWNTVVNEEYRTGRSLVPGTYASAYKSTEPDAYNWQTGEWYVLDSGGWVAASKAAVSFTLDPRNFLNTTNIFMFEKLSYNPSLQTESGVSQMVNGTFMENTGTVGDGSSLNYGGRNYTYPQAMLKAAEESGVSPYHLASRIIQEIGRGGGSNSISGNVSGYSGLYNYFNQGAYQTSSASAIVNGLKYASVTDASTLRPWNSRMRSIIGGAIKIGSSYINKGQNSIYYEKFDLVSPYTHQYMTNIFAPQSESSTASKAYSDSIKSSTPLEFVIPVYQNMPANASARPSGNGNPNNLLKSLNVDQSALTPTFDSNTTSYDVIVENQVTSINVSAEAMISSSSVSGAQGYSLGIGMNTINVTVTAENGDKKTYTINIVRKAEDSKPNPGDIPTPGNPSDSGNPPNPENPSNGGTDTPGGMSTNLNIDEANGIVSGIEPGTNTSDVLGRIQFSGGYSGKITKADNTLNGGIAATGNHLIVTDKNGNTVHDYTVIIYGDVNGDGQVTSMDLLYVKRHILGIKPLEGPYLIAGDANRGGDSVTSLDLLYIKRAVLGIKNIVQ